jgi:Zn-dependent alcohol dehydrogenase
MQETSRIVLPRWRRRSVVSASFDAGRADDVEIAIEYCGVCHSDIHHARNNRPVVRILAGLDARSAASTWRAARGLITRS